MERSQSPTSATFHSAVGFSDGTAGREAVEDEGRGELLTTAAAAAAAAAEEEEEEEAEQEPDAKHKENHLLG